MSLPAHALLIAATGALREAAARDGSTWVRIETAPHEPLTLVDTVKQVLVCTFLGDETHELRAGKFFDGDRTVELVVQVLLPPKIDLAWGGKTVSIDAHTAGAEAAFVAVERLAEVAFATGDPGSWGEMLRRLMTTRAGKAVKTVFLAQSKNGVEVPAVDMSWPIALINAPPPGDLQVQAEGFWPDFIAKMRADAHVAGLADFMAALVAGRIMPPWQVELALAGVAPFAGPSIALGTLPPLTDTPPTTGLSLVDDVGTTLITADT